MEQFNMDVDALFKQTVFKTVNKEFKIDFQNDESFPTEIELFEEFSRNVSESFSRQLQKNFFDALVDEFHQQQH
ncbi:hypothetical protein AS264_14545 [Enterococcus faecium]|nr:hypothetical protein AS264_14545 [Enterococcus faecium]PEX99785.1 hypothetical protein CRN11_07205 [Enterococcus faecium]RAU62149.1 hypothetical protein DPW25_10525 [Enterococcus faecium]RAU66098.1 hypothetical protein DPW26_05350 [Enterococcus faecium]RYJ67926.1 hypothetical protein EWH72_04010 [Enterococcus faecium]